MIDRGRIAVPIYNVNPLYIKLLGQIRHGDGDGEHRHHLFRGHADGVAGRPALAQILGARAIGQSTLTTSLPKFSFASITRCASAISAKG